VNKADAVASAQAELVNLVEIDSSSGREHEIATNLERVLSDLGLPTKRNDVEGCGPNLLVGWDSHPRLLLTAHTDKALAEAMFTIAPPPRSAM
jgi:acetylornithine deacetylase/succinyl-diaminopimelate desuccinylase-like protein